MNLRLHMEIVAVQIYYTDELFLFWQAWVVNIIILRNLGI